LKVSILITCYNFERYIERAIQSLLDQDFEKEYEIIVTDDGSSDRSVQILKSFAKHQHLTIIINEKNIGVAATLNNAYKLAKGEYICRFDGDDSWERTFLTELSTVLDENADVAMAYCDCSYIDENNSITNHNVKTLRKTELVKTNEFKDILKSYYITAPTLIFRKSALDNVFPLPTNLKFLDWFISLSVSQTSKSYYLEKCLSNYRIHSAGMHLTMIRDLNGEETTKKILDKFLTNDIFSTQEQKDIIYNHNKFFILQYFGNKMFGDVRRKTLENVKVVGIKTTAKDKTVLKYFFGSLLGANYDTLKKWFEKIS